MKRQSFLDPKGVCLPDFARILPFGPSCSILLMLFLAARVGMSFLPCPQWGVSSYLCAGPYLQLPLKQSHTCVANAAIPEGVRIANRIDFLTFRKETLTLDARGYRNGPHFIAKRPRAVLFGTSFSFGMALNDEETFSSQINQQIGPVVYNAAGTFDPDLSNVDFGAAARRAGMQEGWILLEVLNRAPLRYSSRAARPSQTGAQTGVRNRIRQITAPATSLMRRVQYPNSISRISTLMSLRLYDDRIFPNPFRWEYPEEELRTGRRVLMFSGDKAFAQKPSGMEGTAGALVALRDDLAPSGFHLAVILLPNAYSVYYPLLRNQEGPDASAPYMLALSSRLAEAGVENLNLLPLLREAATVELREGRMIYFSDDAHWNAKGCAIAARAAVPWLEHLLKGSATASR